MSFSNWPEEKNSAMAPATPAVRTLPLTRCPGCQTPWTLSDDCPRCGTGRREAGGLWQQACDAYNDARTLAATGRLDEARRRLADASRLGLDDPALRRLDALCAAAAGRWRQLKRRDLPLSWRAALRPGSTARRAFAAARRAALRGDWPDALESAIRCTEEAPWLVLAWKLRLLALAGSGRAAAAERLRQTLLRTLPAESDLLRWRFLPDCPAVQTADPPPPIAGGIEGETAVLLRSRQ